MQEMLSGHLGNGLMIAENSWHLKFRAAPAHVDDWNPCIANKIAELAITHDVGDDAVPAPAIGNVLIIAGCPVQAPIGLMGIPQDASVHAVIIATEGKHDIGLDALSASIHHMKYDRNEMDGQACSW